MIEYMPEDYLNTIEDIEDFVLVHPWMRQMVKCKARDLMNDIAAQSWDGNVLLDFLTDEFLGAMAVGVKMGENKILEAWEETLDGQRGTENEGSGGNSLEGNGDGEGEAEHSNVIQFPKPPSAA